MLSVLVVGLTIGLGLAAITTWAWLLLRTWRLRQREESPWLRDVGHMLELVAGPVLAVAVAVVVAVLTAVGVLPAVVGRAITIGVGFLGLLAVAIVGVYVAHVVVPRLGEIARSQRVVTALADRDADRLPDPSCLVGAELTVRETEIVHLIRDGVVSDADLAEVLHISPATVATHVRNILRKTGLSRRRDLLLVDAPAMTMGRAG